MPTTGTKTLIVDLPTDLYDALQAHKQKTGENMAETIRRLIQEALDKPRQEKGERT